ncbi:MAG: hypothetical protein QXT48_01620 [Thermoplasmatales archaeon]
MAKQIVVSDSAELVFKLFERYQGKKWIDYSIFDEKIKEIEDITSRMMEAPPEEKREDLGYFG